MRKFIIDRLSEVTEEERSVLSGSGIDRKLYGEPPFAGDDGLIISDKRMLRAGDLITIRPNTRFTPFLMHGHNYTELMYVVSGSITHTHVGGSVTLSKGDILLLNRHIMHSVGKCGEDDIGINFILSNEFIERVLRKLDGDCPLYRFLSDSLLPKGAPSCAVYSTSGIIPIENLLESLIYSLVCEKQPLPTDILTSEVSLLFRLLARSRDRLVYEWSGPAGKGNLYEKVMSYVSDEYRTASLSGLADRLYLSHGYLSRWISQNMGKTFSDLLLEQRFSSAKRLVITTDMSVSAISSAVGYENRSFFHREFVRRFGVSPLAMRNAARREKDAASEPTSRKISE